MERQETEDIIYLNLIGKASDSERQLLSEWLEEDESHRDFYQRLVNTGHIDALYQLHRDLDADKAWAAFLEKQKISEHSKTAEKKAALFTLHSSLIKYAAAILVFIIAGGGYWYSQYTKVTPPEIPAAVQLAMQQSTESGKSDAVISEVRDLEVRDLEVRGERIESSTGEQEQEASLTSETLTSLTKDQLLAARRVTTMHDKEFWLTLDDGTLVHLNYNTRLIYPEKFGRGNRNVILDGEAYFMVAKDKSRPFIVHTPDGDVKVYGTEFNVNTRIESPNVQSSTPGTSVVLVKGSISVTPTAGKEQMLKPGQMFSIINAQSSIENVDLQPYIAWNEGKFAFRNWSLERIMTILSRWYGCKVEFKNEQIKQMTFSGNLDRYENIQPTMEAIGLSTGLTIQVKPDKIIIDK